MGGGAWRHAAPLQGRRRGREIAGVGARSAGEQPQHAPPVSRNRHRGRSTLAADLALLGHDNAPGYPRPGAVAVGGGRGMATAVVVVAAGSARNLGKWAAAPGAMPRPYRGGGAVARLRV